MNFDELLAPMIEFSSEGIGATLLGVAEFLYELLFPSNADPAALITEELENIEGAA